MSFGPQTGPSGYIHGWHESLAQEAQAKERWRKHIKKVERKRKFWNRFRFFTIS